MKRLFRGWIVAMLPLALLACAGGDRSDDDIAAVDTDVLKTMDPDAPVIPAQEEAVVEKAAGAPLVAAWGYSISNPQYQRLWGSATLIIDTLYNVQVTRYKVSYRFRAPVTGRVTQWKGYWPDGAGYAGGTGGTIKLELVRDDGTALHAPTGAPLATGQYRPRLSSGRHATSAYFDPVAMTSTADLVKGQHYHVVFTNTDSNPGTNFISVNTAASDYRNGLPGRWTNPVDWGVMLQGYGGWKDVTANRVGIYHRVPIMQLTLANGTVFGSSDMETSEVEEAFFRRSDAPVRERFTPKSNKTITGISFSTAARVAGNLKWEFKAGNTVLGSGIVSNSGTFSAPSGMGIYKWFDIALSAPAQLQAGQTYDLVLTPQGSSEWVFTLERNGADYGFQWPAAFTESQAEHYTGGRWIGAYIWNHGTAGRASNWRVVLHQAG